MDKYAEVAAARQAYVQEIDGTGGSGKVGIKNIAIAKKNEYERLDEDYRLLSALKQPSLNEIDSSLVED